MNEQPFNPYAKQWVMMCPNPKRAAENRKRIEEKFALPYWLHLEAQIAGTPWNKPLPSDVPIGEF